MNGFPSVLGILLIVAIVVFFIRKARKNHKPLLPKDKSYNPYTPDDRYNISKKQNEQELDALLEKISKKGLESLSAREKNRLDELSQ